MLGLLGKKIGMTQIFNEAGQWIGVTAVELGPCSVIMKKTKDSDGYEAVQLAYEEAKETKFSKPYQGHFKKKNKKVHRYLKEFKTQRLEDLDLNDVFTAETFEAGDYVDVVGLAKGKGFQGVMKKYNFGGGAASHGCSISHRAPGSIGQCTYPGRVFKGKKMAGRMGGKQITTKNLKIVHVDPEKNLVLIQGSVPGATGSVVTVYSKTTALEDRYLEKKKSSQEAVAAEADQAQTDSTAATTGEKQEASQEGA